MIIELDSIPPSLNKMYMTCGRYRDLSPEARKWKEKTLIQLNGLKTPEEFLEAKLKVQVAFYSPSWHCRNGSIRKRDCSNYEKATMDAIFSSLEGLDDKQIWEITLRKVEAEQEKVSVLIEVYN